MVRLLIAGLMLVFMALLMAGERGTALAGNGAGEPSATV